MFPAIVDESALVYLAIRLLAVACLVHEAELFSFRWQILVLKCSDLKYDLLSFAELLCICC